MDVRVYYYCILLNFQPLSEYDLERTKSAEGLSSPSLMEFERLTLSGALDSNEDDGNELLEVSEEQRISNEHYSKILQWIQFVL